MKIGDLEILRPHYALTLKEWNRRFQTQRTHFAATKGERFCRMWEFYLVTSQTAFEYGDLVVFQLQLGGRDAPVPATRDYLYPSVEDVIARVIPENERVEGLASQYAAAAPISPSSGSSTSRVGIAFTYPDIGPRASKRRRNWLCSRNSLKCGRIPPATYTPPVAHTVSARPPAAVPSRLQNVSSVWWHTGSATLTARDVISLGASTSAAQPHTSHIAS